jgi:hypothetical protein
MEERKKNNILNPADYNRSQNLSLKLLMQELNTGSYMTVTLNNLKAALNINSIETILLKETLTEVEAALLREETDITNVQLLNKPKHR